MHIIIHKETSILQKEIFSVYGKDGMGDAGLVHPSNSCEEEYAVDFILNTIESSPDQIELVALGPVTNIALAIEQSPETMKKVKHIWVMGTSGVIISRHLFLATPAS